MLVSRRPDIHSRLGVNAEGLHSDHVAVLQPHLGEDAVRLDGKHLEPVRFPVLEVGNHADLGQQLIDIAQGVLHLRLVDHELGIGYLLDRELPLLLCGARVADRGGPIIGLGVRLGTLDDLFRAVP